MEKREIELKIFDSLQEADSANAAYYAAMPPRERLNLVLELSARYWGGADETVEGRPRFHRVVELDLR